MKFRGKIIAYLFTQALKKSKSINIWENLEKWEFTLYISYEKWPKIDQTNAHDWTKCSDFTLADSQMIINYNAGEFLDY